MPPPAAAAAASMQNGTSAITNTSTTTTTSSAKTTSNHASNDNNNNTAIVSSTAFADIPSCIAAFRRGEMLIVLDDPSRENEGDLIISAAALTPATCAFLIRHTSGYLCAPLAPARARHLDLPAMVAPGANSDPNRTAYAVTVDACAPHVTTGIGAADRAATCNVLADPRATAHDLRRPGHVVPLIARPGGVRERRGHTEAGWELARLAGIEPAVAVIGELVVDGVEEEAKASVEGRPGYVGAGMMRAEECVAFGRRWGIRCCTIEALVAYVEQTEGRLPSP